MKTVLLSMLVCVAALSASLRAEDKIVSIGSDTMSHLLKNTADAFKRENPTVTIEVQDPGSSAGIGALINGQTEFAPSSRPMKKEEIEKFAEKHNGAKPVELKVALDGIVIYVSKDNPIGQLSLDQIGRIFSQNPNEVVKDSKSGKEYKAMGEKISTWGQVDPNLPAEWKDAKIVLYSRNAASGTYGFFKEHALNNHDFDKAAQEMPGTSAVVNGVAKDKFAIGYGGIGYKTQDVKIVAVAPKTGEPAVQPTLETVSAKQYPISRALQIYLAKKPEGIVKKFADFLLSPAGQKIIGSEEVGFVPLPEVLLNKELEKIK